MPRLVKDILADKDLNKREKRRMIEFMAREAIDTLRQADEIRGDDQTMTEVERELGKQEQAIARVRKSVSGRKRRTKPEEENEETE